MPSIIRATTTSGLQVAPDNSGSLQLQTNGTTTAVTIDTSQNVGIGTTSPSYLLNVSKNGGGSDSAQLVRFTDTSTANSIGPLHLTIGAANHFAVSPSPVLCGTNGIAFGVGDGSDLATQRKMTIDSSGYLCLNRTSALGNAYINIDYSSTGQNAIIIKNTSTTFNGSFIEFRNSAGNTCGNIIQNGTTTVSYSTSSDYRLKDNIVPMVGALETISQLKPVTYKWKIDGSNGQGFIAHELQSVVPDCVTGEKDAVETYTDKDGNEQTRIKPQGIDTSFLVATLTAAIQEQQTIINDLKARIETLEAK